MNTISKDLRIRITIGCFFFFTVVIGVVVTSFLFTPLTFNSTDWEQHRSLRPRMIDDLLASHKLKGMSRNEVEYLLGIPTGQDSGLKNRSIYWVGNDGVIDDIWLDIQFQNDCVTEFSVYPD